MITHATKKRVKERDGWKCLKCGTNKIAQLTIDHIKPVSEGGTDNEDNLQTLCVKCNQAKSNIEELTFWERVKRIWGVYEHLQDFKNRTKGEILSTFGIQFGDFKRQTENMVRNGVSIETFNLKKLVADQHILITTQNEKILKMNSKLVDLEAYLKIEHKEKEIIPEAVVPSKYVKIKIAKPE